MVVVALTTNARLAQAPGNVACRPKASGLSRPSVINVSQVAAVDRKDLDERVGMLAPALMQAVDDGLRLVLALS